MDLTVSCYCVIYVADWAGCSRGPLCTHEPHNLCCGCVLFAVLLVDTSRSALRERCCPSMHVVDAGKGVMSGQVMLVAIRHAQLAGPLLSSAAAVLVCCSCMAGFPVLT